MNRLIRTALRGALMTVPAALTLTGCAKNAPDAVLLPAVQETPSPTSPAFAQAMREGMPFGMLLRHRAELGLTDAQVAQLEAIRQRLQQQNQPLLAQLREAGVRPRAEGMRPGARLQQLTLEQRQELRQQMLQRRQQMTEAEREQLRARMQERREQRLQQLTPEQRRELRQRLQERRAQEGPGVGARAERRVPENLRPVVQQIQENHRAAMQEVRAVLTPEQQERMRELMHEHRRGLMERRATPRGERGPQGTR